MHFDIGRGIIDIIGSICACAVVVFISWFAEYKRFEDQVFTLVRKSSNMRQMVDKLFEKAGFYPKLLVNSAGMRAMQRLAANGQCCSIIPRFYAIPSKNVAYFLLGEDAQWELAAVYRSNHYLNAASRYFIRIASQYFNQHLYLSLIHKY